MVMDVDAARWGHGMELLAIANLEARATTSTGGQPKRFAATVRRQRGQTDMRPRRAYDFF
jgi:hypothetical protein